MTRTEEIHQETLPDTEDSRMQLIGRLSAGLAHDLNGPLGVILGFVQLARERLEQGGDAAKDAAKDVATVAEYLKMIEHAGLNARGLARDMWDFARSRPGESSDFEIEDLLARSARLTAPTLRVAGIEPPSASSDEAAPGRAKVHGDAALWTHAVAGLLLSAPSAIPGGGCVRWDVAGNGQGTVDVTFEAIPGEPLPGTEGKSSDLFEWCWTEIVAAIVENQGGTLDGQVDPVNGRSTVVLSMPLSPRSI